MATAKKKAAAPAKKTASGGDVMSRMKKMKSAWKKAEVREGYSNIPDGDYVAKIESATLGLSPKSNEPRIEWKMVILNEDAAGKKLVKWSNMATEENFEWAKGDIARLELEIPDDPTELPDTLAEAVGLIIEVNCKTKDDFQNIYFNGVLEDYDEEAEEEEEGDEEEETEEEETEEEESDEDEEEEESDEEDEDEEEAEEDEEEVDLDEMDKAELLAFAKEYKLKIAGASKMTEAKLRKAVAAELE